MVLDDRHISYLNMVYKGLIRLKKGKLFLTLRWVSIDKSPVNQTVAAQMHVLGATRIVSREGKLFASLTSRGDSILADEDEAWG